MHVCVIGNKCCIPENSYDFRRKQKLAINGFIVSVRAANLQKRDIC